MEDVKLKQPVYIAPSADVVGNVLLEENCSIWFQAVLRAEHECIQVGKGSNIQDACVVHVDAGFPVKIGENVTIGHGAIIHGCTIGDNTLIGMGAIILNGAKIGKNCIIGAGALVTQGKEIPDGMLAFGSPAKVFRPLTKAEIEENRQSALGYMEHAREYIGK